MPARRPGNLRFSIFRSAPDKSPGLPQRRRARACASKFWKLDYRLRALFLRPFSYLATESQQQDKENASLLFEHCQMRTQPLATCVPERNCPESIVRVENRGNSLTLKRVVSRKRNCQFAINALTVVKVSLLAVCHSTRCIRTKYEETECDVWIDELFWRV